MNSVSSYIYTLLSPLSKSRRQSIARLNKLKIRRKERLFMAEGHKSVLDLLSRGDFEPVRIIGSEEFWNLYGDKVLSHSSNLNDALHIASIEDLKSISTLSSPPDSIAVFKMPSQCAAEIPKKIDQDLYLMLDGVQDPGNLGTIIRTCHWFGIRKIFASPDTVDVYNSKTIQSTMGSLGAVEVYYTDLPALVRANPGIPVVGLQLEGKNLFTSSLPSSAFICMGSEGNGLSEDMVQLLSESYTIPSANPSDSPESLNVAIATAITVAQFIK